MAFRDKLPKIKDRRVISKITGLKLKLYAIRQKPEVDLRNYDPNGFRRIIGRDIKTGQFISLNEVHRRLSRQYSEFN